MNYFDTLPVQTILDAIPSLSIITNGKQILYANEEFLSFFSYKSIEEFQEKHNCVCELFLDENNLFSLKKISKEILWTSYLYSKLNRISRTVAMLNTNKEIIYFEISLKQISDNCHNYIIVFTNITSLLNEKNLLDKISSYDYLTNIYNRYKFNKILKSKKENKKRYGDKLSLILLDIDKFKEVNDTYGHSIGDDVLINLVDIIQKNIRTSDVFARWGGEEFIILLPRLDKNLAYNKAEELRQIIENNTNHKLPNITVSFGITEILDSDSASQNNCFKRADEALYKAKISRNCCISM